MSKSSTIAMLIVLLSVTRGIAGGQASRGGEPSRSRTKLVMLGTGNPSPNPDRFGPATVVLVDNVPYLIDCGVGVVRRWAAAIRVHKLPSRPVDLKTVFITHLHTDHTLGFAELIFTPWTNVPAGSPAAARPLEVFGPPGLIAMTRNLLAAYIEDVQIRTSEGGSRNLSGSAGPTVNSHEIDAGEIYRDERVTVVAFRVPHGNWEHAYGFKFRTPDKTIVISGDTAYTPEIARQCSGCDLLVHEGGFNDGSAYFRASHTNAEELARVAIEARPKRLVLYHQRDVNEEGARIIRSKFSGPVIVAADLQMFE
jgi:ribonuclease BN (tRNA processing enzyme)